MPGSDLAPSERAPTSVVDAGPVVLVSHAFPVTFAGGVTGSDESLQTGAPSSGSGGTTDAPAGSAPARAGLAGVPPAASAPTGPSGSTYGGSSGAAGGFLAAWFGHRHVDPPTDGSLLPRTPAAARVIGGTNDPGGRPG